MTLRSILRRLFSAFITLMITVAINFGLLRIVKSDPVATMTRGRKVSAEKRAELREKFGLDDSMLVQFLKYLKELAKGNLGYSFQSGKPVTSEILNRVWPTINLIGISTALAAAIGIWLGIRAGWRPGSAFDRISTSTTMFFYSTSDAFLGLLLAYLFTKKLQWFPTGGIIDPRSDATGLTKLLEQAHHMVLPATVLVVGYLGQYSLVMRASILETSKEDFLNLARAKGARDDTVRRRHAVPNALLPSITLVALNIGFVLGGAIVVETLFTWPGLGLSFSRALGAQDFPMLQGLFLVSSASVILLTLLADLLYARLDPRVTLV
jgi:peptide/nickel transport system permease protein